MGSLKRKMARKKAARAKKDIKQKMGLFDKIGDECLVCQKDFDKTDKEQVTSWFVAVRKEEGKVNLYCTDCWERGQKLVQQLGEKDEEVLTEN